MKPRLKLAFCIALPLLVWAIPTSWLGIDGLTVVEHRLIAIFVMALVFWILEPIPLYATSLLIIFLELVLISDKGFYLFMRGVDKEAMGPLLPYQDILATFASPIIILFLGGFFLALAATKFQMDISLAKTLLRPFGTKPAHVLLGLMIVTAVFSMFMSNTATTAMMLAVLAPVLRSLHPGDRIRTAFVLAVPFAANIGGMGTPIGTPPNAISLKYLAGADAVGFSTWMSFAVPYVILLLAFLWGMLLIFYKPQTAEIKVRIEGGFQKNWKSLTAAATFLITILLWLLDFWHGMNSYIVALIPVVVFSLTRIITAVDLRDISWDVLWLMAGGIALGMGIERTGLAAHIIGGIEFSSYSPVFIVFLATLITVLMATFMSNTATANLLLPLMAILGTSVSSLAGLGGVRMIVLAVAFSSSLAMSLPVSTPPNAIAYAAGGIKTKDMFKTGALVGVVGLAALYLMMAVLRKVGFLG
jgi:solute carrier family 13 (sodium-dependent dicarboxylate transporter), member 2/3/5